MNQKLKISDNEKFHQCLFMTDVHLHRCLLKVQNKSSPKKRSNVFNPNKARRECYHASKRCVSRGRIVFHDRSDVHRFQGL